jgi:hypothetical protein
MNNLTPLLLLWMISRKGIHAPLWPSAASPPPMPGLPPMPSAETGTPLSELAQPRATPKSKAAPPRDKKIRLPPMDKVTASVLRKKGVIPSLKMGPPPPAQVDVNVSSIQSALVRNGYKSIKRDGLYGPKTALAWQALAHGKALSPMIARVSAHRARVARDTYTKLSIP